MGYVPPRPSFIITHPKNVDAETIRLLKDSFGRYLGGPSAPDGYARYVADLYGGRRAGYMPLLNVALLAAIVVLVLALAWLGFR